MRALCPTCETAYSIPDDRIGPKGRKVRCTRCGEEWRVMPPEEAEEAVPVRATVVAPPARRAPEIVPEVVEPPAPAPRIEVEPVRPITPPPAPPVASAPPPSPVSPPSPAPVTPPAPPKPAATVAARSVVGDEPPAATADPLPRSVEQPAEPVKIRIRTKPLLAKLLPDWLKNFEFRDVFAGLSRLVGPAFFLATCLAVATLVAFRTPIVAAHPDFAGLYAAIGLDVNLRGLAFERIETLREIENGQPVLVVEGAVVNTTRDTREVPALRFALRGNDAQELYAWSLAPKTAALAAGDSFRFRTRLAAPPDQAADVQVRFVERRNLQAGLP